MSGGSFVLHNIHTPGQAVWRQWILSPGLSSLGSGRQDGAALIPWDEHLPEPLEGTTGPSLRVYSPQALFLQETEKDLEVLSPQAA